jgi:release factor glutamine methyltransferase
MSQQPTIQNMLHHSAEQLAATLDLPPNEARIEARLLLCHVMQCDHAWLIAHMTDEMSQANIWSFQALLNRRLSGEPIAYIVGYRDFFDMRLHVTPATLIPRSDTEILVELALEKIPEDAEWNILDLGTGSGAIVLALAKHRPCCKFLAIDQSAEALKIAQENAQALGLTHVKFSQGTWFSPLSDMSFDLIVSNPPYIAEDDQHLKQGDLRYEPIQALSSGHDGLYDIRHIIENAKAFLKSHGGLILEHGFNQASQIAEIAKKNGASEVIHYKDLSQHNRVTSIRY